MGMEDSSEVAFLSEKYKQNPVNFKKTEGIGFLQDLIEYRIKHQKNLNLNIITIRDAKRVELFAPLFFTVCKDTRLDLTKQLLRHGADPNITTQDCVLPPLITAIEYGALDTVRALLDAGANQSFKCKDGRSTLYYACRYAAWNMRTGYGGSEWWQGKNRLKCIRLLLQYGADPNVASNVGHTPIVELIDLHVDLHAEKHIKLLLKYGATLPLTDRDGKDIYGPPHFLDCILPSTQYLRDVKEGRIKLEKLKKKLR